MNPAIGTIQCPLSVAAGSPHDATVHQQNSKRKPYYYRCACGTMQPLTETGQMMMTAVIESHTPPSEKPGKDADVDEAGAGEKPKDDAPPAPAGKSISDFFFGDDDA